MLPLYTATDAEKAVRQFVTLGYNRPMPVTDGVTVTFQDAVDAFSGHADRNELRRCVESLTGNIKKISVIHGKESQCLAFAETLRQWKPKAE